MFFTLKISEYIGRTTTETTIIHATVTDLEGLAKKYEHMKQHRYSDSEIRFYADKPENWSVRVRILAKFS